MDDAETPGLLFYSSGNSPSAGEATRTMCARIEISRPGILISFAKRMGINLLLELAPRYNKPNDQAVSFASVLALG